MNVALLAILAAAVFYDVRQERVPNGLILAGMVLTAGQAVILGRLSEWLFGMGIPILLLFPLFWIRGLGAGDIKLLSVIGSFSGWKVSCSIILAAFFAGFVLSVYKILRYHQFFIRMRYLAHYISKCKKENQITPYYRKEEGSQKERIHFTVPILFAYLLYLGGII